MKTEAGLTPKQEKFCMAYIETGNAAEAYRRSYDGACMKGATVKRKAAEVLERPNVTARVAELQAKAAEKHEITVERLTLLALDTYEKAMAENQMNAAVSALMALGKMHGLIIEKKHVVADHAHAHLHRSVSDTSEWLAKLLGHGGEELALPKPLQN